MYALLLYDAGDNSYLDDGRQPRTLRTCLESGQIDVVPEYAATFADWLNAKTHGADAPPVGSP